MPLVFIFFKIFAYFLFLDPIEIFLHYPNADSSHWFSEDVQRIVYKAFREELIIVNCKSVSVMTAPSSVLL